MEIIQESLPSADLIRERRLRIEERLRAVAEAAGRDPAVIRIVAITKTWPVEVARAALEAGLAMLGENRVQEALPKVAAVPEVEWHLVGHLQSNKARKAVEAFAVIHSVDSLELLQRLDGLAAQADRQPRLLLQVNLSGEAAKEGFERGWMEAQSRSRGELAAVLGALRAARPVGLMTIARLGADEEEARSTFAGLRRLRDALQETSGMGLPELSMGMTADVEAAVAEGATLVRIGTALFGARPV